MYFKNGWTSNPQMNRQSQQNKSNKETEEAMTLTTKTINDKETK